MPPLFLYQATMLRPQIDRTGDHTPLSTSPPANEILDSLLTGYLWGCLLVALFLVVYFAISFCAWAIGAALTTIDTVVDCLRPRDVHPDAHTDAVLMASSLFKTYKTAYPERIFSLSEDDMQMWRCDKTDKGLEHATSRTERDIVLEEKGSEESLKLRIVGNSIDDPIHHTSSGDVVMVDTIPNTSNAFPGLDRLAVSIQL
ncbi:hypothetical protein GT037_010109 [Alternaria burnsii]|uniref:Uncharacterized protein n=1 Tax=Alternaria burnsii TaxID=1187904 RepID=A0A8H7EDH2_9PLEO|nr:uncharacterized protein GT037_010109 [Alternaria burnsii]KAF7671886.1 hypothetical protein GT037_010109 [Alternaria burnsii]CAI9631019.1 unnamed protein product [Alternaria burnsii]